MAILAAQYLTAIKEIKKEVGYNNNMYFRDRIDAGKQLAAALSRYKDMAGAIVLALPRGGVPVAFEVAQALRLPLDLMLVRKLGLPGHEELAMGAIADTGSASGHVQVLNEDVVQGLQIPKFIIAQVAKAEYAELERRSKSYRQGKPPPRLEGKTVILIDDGCATGSNMKAAVCAVAKENPDRIVVAVPVASESAYEMLREAANDVICLDIPEPFHGVGAFYLDFSQTSDAEVKSLLRKSCNLHLSKEQHA